MSQVIALTVAGWQTALSYRIQTVNRLIGLLVSVVPLYFVAEALQPTMASVIQGEGGQYFGFVLIGLVGYSFLSVAVSALPRAIQMGVRTGTLEALFATPARLPSLLAGMVGYDFSWTALRVLLTVSFAVVLGARVAPEGLVQSLFIVALIVAAHIPFGVMAAAGVIAFRTAGPFPRAIITLSTLLGGVYYPTHVIPSWLEGVAGLIPLTYGLRALRMSLLEGASMASVAGDVLILSAFTVVLLLVSAGVFFLAFRYARRSGTLVQY